MQTSEIIQQIQSLPIVKRYYVIEETLKSIKKEENQQQMEVAVNVLYDEYLKDKELTAFTSLDLELFYTTK